MTKLGSSVSRLSITRKPLRIASSVLLNILTIFGASQRCNSVLILHYSEAKIVVVMAVSAVRETWYSVSVCSVV